MENLYSRMKTHVSDERIEKIEAVSLERTRYITFVLNNIFYTQNISAVLRSCDCFGIQDLYITGNSPSTHINKHVALGAINWVDVHRKTYLPEEDTLSDLKKRGYRIVVTLPEPGATSLYDFNLEAGKAAIVMGNEKEGVSETVKKMADEYLYIPMSGFSQSLNISVSAAVIMSEMVRKLSSSGIDWKISGKELENLKYEWIKKSVKQGDRIEDEYLIRMSHPNDQADEKGRLIPRQFYLQK